MLGKEIFNPTPKQFGLRGDDNLWEFLKSFEYSEDSVYSEILTHFMDVVGEPDAGNEKYISWLAKGGGMSEGIVSVQWWHDVGFPLLKTRIDAIQGE